MKSNSLEDKKHLVSKEMRKKANKVGFRYVNTYNNGHEEWKCSYCGLVFILPDDYESYVLLHKHPSLRPVRWLPEKITTFKAESLSQRRIISDLTIIASFEVSNFEGFHPSGLKKHFAAYGIAANRMVFGYALWSYRGGQNTPFKKLEKIMGKENLALRQIYLRPQYRRKGYGKTLLEASFQDLGPEEPWGVESPNDSFIVFLAKTDTQRS